jgi:hypothetical protein
MPRGSCRTKVLLYLIQEVLCELMREVSEVANTNGRHIHIGLLRDRQHQLVQILCVLLQHLLQMLKEMLMRGIRHVVRKHVAERTSHTTDINIEKG